MPSENCVTYVLLSSNQLAAAETVNHHKTQMQALLYEKLAAKDAELEQLGAKYRVASGKYSKTKHEMEAAKVGVPRRY